MRHFKAGILLLLAFSLISPSIIFANNTSTDKGKDNCVTVRQEIINEEDEFFKSDIKYPILEINSKCKENNKPKENTIEEINKNISTYIMNFKNRIQNEAKQYKNDYINIYSKSDKDYVKYQYEAYSNYNVTYNKNNLISIPITTYEFTGGAHGMTYLKSFNYDLKTGEELKLSDIFKEEVDYKKITNAFIKNEISKTPGNYFDGEEGFKGISDNQNFYLEDDGVVVYFSLYEIAPYSSGIPKFKLSYKDFGMYMRN
ncbi:DUF3298/DUF4163 domain-containing protein [Romboutsia weinsteinii]|uniref:DUF3298/DUF4163 domain-containing protein n=1 Tax=Romboutsia weinsteinii TaxID=2020949 RepID=A0A371IZ35_9FIRM|nr:DUF3298 and DUF4163 domain-containing protein [Romboutsia weinsteinii]RDY25738.1 DUF3298/DUF4163 domain-containing protein [Romboutsia weinsteinii]